MSIKKQYQKDKALCKVTFNWVGKDETTKTVQLVGEFNNWDTQCELMKPLKSNQFSQTVNLVAGRSYQFRYLVNGEIWENDAEADEYVSNGIADGEFNSLVLV